MKEYFEKCFNIIENETDNNTVDFQFSKKEAVDALRFHKSLPQYKETPLISLNYSAEKYGINSIFVKDESTRFNLKAFKGLGGSYAMFRILCDKLGIDYKNVDYKYFQHEDIKKKCSDIKFITATDGNHGKGVSWAAKLFGCRAHILMPKNSAQERKEAIEKAGSAFVEITDMNYDMTVNYAFDLAKKNNLILIQDTAWEGYEKYPKWIIEGYLTMALEISEQLKEKIPTHIFLQAGVGAMAGGISAYFQNLYNKKPIITIVEPKNVACIYESIKKSKLYTIEGCPITIMAGLNCNTPCKITFPILKNCSKYFCACDDDIAKQGMRAYIYPCGDDKKIISGESGAVTYGLLIEILKNNDLRKIFKINDSSIILLINTEGDTCPEIYNKIILS